MACFVAIIQLLIHSSASFWSYGIQNLHGIWSKIERLNPEITY